MLSLEDYPLASVNSDAAFNTRALELFRWQAHHVEAFAKFLAYSGRNWESIQHWTEIPLMPVSAFKHHLLIPSGLNAECVFSSSATSGSKPSEHHVVSTALYHESFEAGFIHMYGNPDRYCILALLPAYLERSGSSLVYMADALIRSSSDPRSGFFLNQWEQLAGTLAELQQERKPTILLGVTFALLDFSQQFNFSFPELIVMETGGMKGRRKEMIREEVHATLRDAFGVQHIHSEYGMTELLSQAYAKRDGLFNAPPWMRVRMMDHTDPFTELSLGRTGRIGVIDLANRFSCGFIATDDLGKAHPDGSFEVLGRLDDSDIRGCNLMVF